jgi:hypothetical protein
MHNHGLVTIPGRLGYPVEPSIGRKVWVTVHLNHIGYPLGTNAHVHAGVSLATDGCPRLASCDHDASAQVRLH